MALSSHEICGAKMPAKLKRTVLALTPFWLLCVGFACWSFFLASKDVFAFPGFRPILAAASGAVVIFPYMVLWEWLYATGKVTRPKPRPWVRKLMGSTKPDDKR
jgi:hypothetical protein